MGRLVAIEGIDGSGKGTQAKRLRDSLVAEGLSVELTSFPRYESTFFGRAIGDYLNGRYGETVDPHLAAVLFAGDRFESRSLLAEAVANADIVLLDRYVASNVAHQGAKLPADERERLARWILELEHDVFGLPRADLVLLLDVPVDVAQHRIAEKAARSYTDKPADLHEADTSHLAAAREAYRSLAATEPGWHTVPCAGADGAIRAIEEIGDEMLRVVRDSLSA